MQTALLIIDVQNGVCHGSQPVAKLESVIQRINARIARYRAAHAPIIFVQHTDEGLQRGTNAWQLILEINSRPGDLYVTKTHANAFFKTDLQRTLNNLNVRQLEVAGAQVEFCVDTTIKMAHGLGYQLTMVPGTTTTTANPFLTAQQTIDFYEQRIWSDRFVTMITLTTTVCARAK